MRLPRTLRETLIGAFVILRVAIALPQAAGKKRGDAPENRDIKFANPSPREGFGVGCMAFTERTQAFLSDRDNAIAN
ncbi:hypothetical protein Pla22_36070 [Rubripirellula amarantea]|uniref:Uncharacterized protein n=1 Tax=Rubripirellula amarantea TaxID=2527999 RepID=A0A5C5WJ56_9BACT|nr:hypothetical protein [Rubripirellula amarantea]TWT50864.1 hypothetical protein Pla22_36070 [Rubripirellula amarantea]